MENYTSVNHVNHTKDRVIRSNESKCLPQPGAKGYIMCKIQLCLQLTAGSAIVTVLQTSTTYIVDTITYLCTSMNKKRMNSFQELCA